MGKKIAKLFFAALFFILAFSFVSAETNNSYVHELQKAANNLKCKTDFSVGVINSLVASYPSDTLSQYMTKLQNDLTQLQTYAASNDKDSFKSYLKNTYDADFKSAKEAIREWRKTKKNLTAEQRTSLRTTYSQLKTEYDTCHLASLKEYATGRINSFNSILDANQKRIDALATKGIDVAPLNQVMQDAKSQIIQPMQDAVNAASDVKSVNAALKGYCLYDGCKDGINFHFAAKWEIAKLDIALAKIKSNSSATQEQKTKLENYINAAKTALNNVVKTARYTAASSKQVWDNIKSANALVKDISKALKEKNE